MEININLMYEATMGELHKVTEEMIAYKGLSMQLQKENDKLKEEIARMNVETKGAK